ncbi:MAG: hypothetical protein A2826_00255 [Candidatus Doudnabacteria bacterium RIFCSPHIGHO2_01_FULL_43_23]|uniref:Lipoprotein n=1 Tax=Candidatus Doudnabacteria bacterium RIFCSPHIGHO2_01_FULL_43_23 TaxID=1817822 RepID=A0A1F5NTP3_9BACT|nr:MAG: hypothetical protein A2826_00255 [Candidatus Doudnabacteria bacterium RIFCSPHIGHO2_01_FULL_43_23]
MQKLPVVVFLVLLAFIPLFAGDCAETYDNDIVEVSDIHMLRVSFKYMIPDFCSDNLERELAEKCGNGEVRIVLNYSSQKACESIKPGTRFVGLYRPDGKGGWLTVSITKTSPEPKR